MRRASKTQSHRGLRSLLGLRADVTPRHFEEGYAGRLRPPRSEGAKRRPSRLTVSKRSNFLCHLGRLPPSLLHDLPRAGSLILRDLCSMRAVEQPAPGRVACLRACARLSMQRRVGVGRLRPSRRACAAPQLRRSRLTVLCGVTWMVASALLKAMLRGPYERRRRPLRQRLLRVGVRGWLWVVAAAVAVLVVGLRLV